VSPVFATSPVTSWPCR